MPEALGIWAFLLVSFALFIPHSMDLTNVASYRKKNGKMSFLIMTPVEINITILKFQWKSKEIITRTILSL